MNKNDDLSFPTTITGYYILHSDSEKKSSGVGIYIDSSISYQIKTDIPNVLNDSESLWIEINLHKKPCIIGVIYRHSGYDISAFTENICSGESRIIFLPERSSFCQYPPKISAINIK